MPQTPKSASHKQNSYTIAQHSFAAKSASAGLYIVSTPIGNLGDMTIRGLEILASADLIACEDTRVTGKLLNHFAIKTKMLAYHEHNAEREGPLLIERLQNDEVIALTSDAGTPLISDPGERLVASAISHELPVYSIPGASAPLAALTASGFPTGNFSFHGFLPSKQTARKTALASLADMKGTLVFFENPSRLSATLLDMADIFGGERQGAICRELTKLYENIRRGPIEQLQEFYAANPARGEIVIVISPKAENSDAIDIDALLIELLASTTVSRAAAEAAKLTGRSKRDLYARALALKEAGGKETNG